LEQEVVVPYHTILPVVVYQLAEALYTYSYDTQLYVVYSIPLK
jgi:hypothetical protein